MEQQLIQIHNALCTISTKGEDSIVIANCLLSLRQIIESLQKTDEKEEE